MGILGGSRFQVMKGRSYKYGIGCKSDGLLGGEIQDAVKRSEFAAAKGKWPYSQVNRSELMGALDALWITAQDTDLERVECVLWLDHDESLG